MASFTDRLVMLIEAQVKNAGAVKGLAHDVGQVDQAAGKAAASGGKLSQAWGAAKSMGLDTAAVVTTVAALAVKSVQAFEGLAKQAIDMGAALGVSTDEASRWIAVADDFQVPAAAMTKGLLSVERSAAGSGEAIAAAGGQIRRAADGTVDVSATMESVATGLASIHDPAAKAAAGTALFGKNWATLAPIMDEGGAAIDRAMKSVSDGQVITEDEAKSAEEMRLAQDHLHDSLMDLELAAGKVLAQFAPLIDVVSTAIDWYEKLVGTIDDVEKKLGPLGEAMKSFTNPVGFLGDAIHLFGGKSKEATKPVADLTEGMDEATQAAQDMKDAYDEMTGELDQESSLLRARDAFDDLTKAVFIAAAAQTKGGQDSVVANRKVQEQAISTKESVIRYAKALGDIPPAKLTTINAAIDRGDYAEAQRLLDDLSKSRTAHIDINAFASLTLAPGTPGTIRTYLPVGRTTGPAARGAAAAAGALPAGATAAAPTPALATTTPAPVIVINSPMIGNPAHVSDAVLAGYLRAQRLNGPRQVVAPT